MVDGTSGGTVLRGGDGGIRMEPGEPDRDGMKTKAPDGVKDKERKIEKQNFSITRFVSART